MSPPLPQVGSGEPVGDLMAVLGDGGRGDRAGGGQADGRGQPAGPAGLPRQGRRVAPGNAGLPDRVQCAGRPAARAVLGDLRAYSAPASGHAVLSRGSNRRRRDGGRVARPVQRALKRTRPETNACDMHDSEVGVDLEGNGMSDSPAARLQAALRGAPADADPAAHRAQHGAPGRRRAVPVQRGAGRTGRGQPALRHPLRGRPRLRRLPGAAQAPARGRPGRGGRGRRRRTTSTSRPSRPRSRTCGTSPSCSPTRAPVQRAGRLLAASRPLPVLGLRAAASQAVRLRVLRRQGPPGRTAARRGRHDAPRPYRRRRAGRRHAPCCASRCPGIRARSWTPWPTPRRRG